MLRFVILTHDHPHLHWDFMLEQEKELWTWRLNEEPSLHTEIASERLADHRLFYLDYEGPVSGDRGTVSRWDTGTYELLSHKGETIRGVLHGAILNGVFALTIKSFRIS